MPEFALRLDNLKAFQEKYGIPVTDASRQAPAAALESLRSAAAAAPPSFKQYLSEAIDCYATHAYRGAILMIWAAAMESVYRAIESQGGGFRRFEKANAERFKDKTGYRRVRGRNDLLYLQDSAFIQVCEDAGVINRNGRALLLERLRTRNLCAHPTQFELGREGTVIFIESLINNFINGAMVSWPESASRADI